LPTLFPDGPLVQFLTEAPSVPRVDAIALGIRSAPRRPTTLAIYALIDLSDLVKDGSLALDMSDEITRGVCITRDGAVVHEGVAKLTAGGVA